MAHVGLATTRALALVACCAADEMDTALAGLGAAIQAELKQAMASLRLELDEERQMRRLLEQQVDQLKQVMYTSSEVDRKISSVQQLVNDSAATTKADSENALRAAQRELEYRIEAALKGLQNQAAESEKPRAAPEDTQLLNREIDRKLGTILVDIDQRLTAAKAELETAMEAAVHGAVEHADAGCNELRERLGETSTASETALQELRRDLSSRDDAEGRLSSRMDTVRTSLEQKIGMVQLDVDQLRREFDKNRA